MSPSKLNAGLAVFFSRGSQSGPVSTTASGECNAITNRSRGEGAFDFCPRPGLAPQRGSDAREHRQRAKAAILTRTRFLSTILRAGKYLTLRQYPRRFVWGLRCRWGLIPGRLQTSGPDFRCSRTRLPSCILLSSPKTQLNLPAALDRTSVGNLGRGSGNLQTNEKYLLLPRQSSAARPD
jgi:hypothetical protein